MLWSDPPVVASLTRRNGHTLVYQAVASVLRGQSFSGFKTRIVERGSPRSVYALSCRWQEGAAYAEKDHPPGALPTSHGCLTGCGVDRPVSGQVVVWTAWCRAAFSVSGVNMALPVLLGDEPEIDGLVISSQGENPECYWDEFRGPETAWQVLGLASWRFDMHLDYPGDIQVNGQDEERPFRK
jgi:hypothetical protein